MNESLENWKSSLQVDVDAMKAQSGEPPQHLTDVANAQRLRILWTLVEQELTVSQINEQLPDLSLSALSQHLARLRKQALVPPRREAQNVWYSLSPGLAQAVIETLYGIFCGPAD